MINNEQLSFKVSEADNTPVVCLGMTFESEEARREYFREELRKKLPELKKIEGFPIGEDEDIIALSDPPYYTACPNPWIEDFLKINHNSNSGEIKNVKPYTLDVIEGKSDALYNAHSYHTKVPHKAIMHLILHYTNPGDYIYDGFCGTGMTGVAATLCGNKDEVESLGYKVDSLGNISKKVGSEWVVFSRIGKRNAILNDLSPIASFISSNYNLKNSNDISAAKKIINDIESELIYLYLTTPVGLDSEISKEIYESISTSTNLSDFRKICKEYYDKGFLKAINYTILSDIYTCENCTHNFVYWNEAVNQEHFSIKENFICPSCSTVLSKKISLEKKLAYSTLI